MLVGICRVYVATDSDGTEHICTEEPRVVTGPAGDIHYISSGSGVGLFQPPPGKMATFQIAIDVPYGDTNGSK